MSLLEVVNLNKRFQLHLPGKKVIIGCTGVSFNLSAGEFLGLYGPSGAGKSTVLKCIYRTYLPTSGDIWYDSILYGKVNISVLPEHIILDIRKREIGYVSQFFKVVPRISAIDIVAEPLISKKGTSAREAKNKAAMLLERLKIPENLFDAYPCSFSGGQQQRLNIARAVIWSPRLMLLDEPTASLDSNSVKVVTELLLEMKREGVSMIGIFHDQSFLASIADRICRIEQKDIHAV